MNVDSERNERGGALIAALDLLGEEVVSIAPAYYREDGVPHETEGTPLTIVIKGTTKE